LFCGQYDNQNILQEVCADKYINKFYLFYNMAEAITLDRLYEELKLIEKKMVTKDEIEQILETAKILSNENTIAQIKQSEKDIKAGRIKEVKSISDI